MQPANINIKDHEAKVADISQHDIDDLRDLEELKSIDNEIGDVARQGMSFERLNEVINRIQMALNHEQQKLYKAIGRSTEKLRKSQVQKLADSYRDKKVYWLRITGGFIGLVSAFNQIKPEAGYGVMCKLNQWGESIAKRMGVFNDNPIPANDNFIVRGAKRAVQSFVETKVDNSGIVNGVLARTRFANKVSKFKISYITDLNPYNAARTAEENGKIWSKIAQKTSALIDASSKMFETFAALEESELNAVRTPLQADGEVLRRRKEEIEQEATQEGQRKDSASQAMKKARQDHHDAITGMGR